VKPVGKCRRTTTARLALREADAAIQGRAVLIDERLASKSRCFSFVQLIY